MLPRQQRFLLRQHPTFFQHAQRVSVSSATAFFQPASSFSTTVIVSKKVAPLAVSRHKIKRCIYQALKNLEVAEPISLVISVRRGAQVLQLQDWQSEMEQLLLKIRKYRHDATSDYID